jgi:hypothetical protein
MHLTLDRPALVESLSWLRRKRKALPMASVGEFMGQAQIACGPLEVSVPCHGDWQGVATFDSGLLMMLAKEQSKGKTVEMRYADGRICIDNVSATASWARV